MESPDHLPYANALRRVGHRPFSLSCGRSGTPPATMSECRTSATRTGARSSVCCISYELTIVLRYAGYMGDLRLHGSVTPTAVALRETPTAYSLGWSRNLPPPSPVAVDSGVLKCTKATPYPPSHAPQPSKESKDLALYDATAGVRQEDAGTTRSTGPS